MNCANCGQPYADTDVFCGTCGADLNAQRAAAAAAQQPVAPTAPLQPTAVMPTQVAGPAAPAVQPAAQPAAQAPKKSSKTLLIVLAILGGLLLLCSCAGVGTWAVLAGPFKQTTEISDNTPPQAQETTEPAASDGKGGASSTSSYPTADDAIKAELPADWVMRKTNETAQQVEYWAGPPNSEFTTVYVVSAQGDGTWRVSEVGPLDQGGDVQPEDEARAVVEQFEQYIQSDQADKAHALTMQPFSSDGASAAYSNGEFLSFEIKKVETAGDNSYFVTVTEKWKNGTDTWVFRVRPTDSGMKISDLMPAP